MNDLTQYIISKSLEKASIEIIKQSILQDTALTQEQKTFWIGYLNGVSITRDAQDILSVLFNKKIRINTI